jgi:DNA replication initiation complex subunit (GINS family)
MDISELLKLWRAEKSASQPAKMPPHFYNDSEALMHKGDPYEAKKATDLYNDIVHMRQHKMLMGCLREISGNDGPENLLPPEKSAYKTIRSELAALRAGTHVEEAEEEVQVEEESQEEVQEEAQDEEQSAQETPEAPKAGHGAAKDSEGSEDVKMPARREALCEEKDGSLSCSVGDADAQAPAEKPAEAAPLEKQEVFKAETENKALSRVRFLRNMPAFVGPDLSSLGPFEEGQVIELDDEIAEILLKNDAVELAEE